MYDLFFIYNNIFTYKLHNMQKKNSIKIKNKININYLLNKIQKN